MFLYKKLALGAIAVLLGVPSVSLAGSFTVSLIQGKTPAEAVQIIAEQIDLLTGRVSSLENKQAQTDAELDALRAENDDLRAKADAAISASSEYTKDQDRRTQCNELGAELDAKRRAVQAPYRAQIEPLQEQLRAVAQKTASGGLVYDKPQADAETQVLLDRLDSGEEMGDLTQEERDKVYAYQSLNTQAQVNAIKEINAKKKELTSKIDAVSVEMDKAVEALNATTEVKALQAKLDELLCA